MSMHKTLCKMRVNNVRLKLLNIYSTTILAKTDLHFARETELKERLDLIHKELGETFTMLEVLNQKITELEVK